ncbi:MAG: YHS domain-containing protein, partial [Acidobacteriota bacterium]|nr:YHS domain-containing protein [Acidobacteriota bacterium]
METTITGKKVKDPVCGMTIDEETARRKSEYEGKTYHFCSKSCLETFEQNPAKFVSANGNIEVGSPVKNEDVMSGRRNDHSTVSGAGERVDLPITGM